jgi:hypothetical protein
MPSVWTTLANPASCSSGCRVERILKAAPVNCWDRSAGGYVTGPARPPSVARPAAYLRPLYRPRNWYRTCPYLCLDYG